VDTIEVARHWEENAERWTAQSRAGLDVYRDALNTPAFLAFLPDVNGLDGLDIGCGEGSNTRKVAERGARMHAIDVAPTFVRHARETEAADPRGIRYQVADATALPFPDASFDFATAFMCLMDVADQPAALREAARVLRPGGFLQFSILHPCFVPPRRRNARDADGRVVAVEIADYFRETDGEMERWWLTGVPASDRASVPPFAVPRFHRTLTSWVGMITGAGLAIEALAEPMADDATALAVPAVADTRVAPLFLHARARKPD
jgi:SAM-dependent methyltransferase